MSDPSVPLTPDTTSRTPEEATRAMAMPVLDPMWMLARQWQTGELHAEDAGSVVALELTLDTASFDRLETRAGTVETADPGPAPLQLVVDAEPVLPLSARPLGELAAAGLELLRTLEDHGAAAARDTFTGDRYRLVIGDDEWALLEPASRTRLRPWRDRVPDPRRVAAVVAGALGSTGDAPMPRIPELPPDLDLAVLARLEAALRDWLHWLDPVSSRAPTGACWSPQRLESAFSITATTTSARVRLRAPEHLGGDIDWHSFVRSEMPAGGIVTLPQHSVLPAPVRYPGMPLARLWEVEDGNVNLDLFGFQTGDIGVLALLAFVHQHANDWFSVPVELPTGTITAVRALSATTTFGERIPIPAAALLDGPGAPWQLFAISPDPEAPTGPVDPASPLVLAHSAGHHLTGPVVEDVLLVRDEMANLAWAVEGTTQDLSGQPVDRFARYQRLRPPAVEDVEGARRYRLGSTVPDNWYPLEAARDAEGSPVLALSRLPGEAADVSDLGVQGTLLDHGAGAFVYDEEVPREGALIVRRWHRARWTDGRSLVWASRLKRPGRREGSSGLRFDYLAEPGTAGAAAEATRPNLLRNPDFARGRLVAPGPLVGGGVPGQSAAEDWTLWNNPVATTSTQLEPTTRLGGTGHMLRIATSSPACGLVQQWAPTDSGPAAAVAAAWVYVVRGSVMMGCGNGGDTGMDVATRSRGRWELIEAPHGRSPVNEIILYAADSDGAEFLVDHVAVRVG